MEKYEVVYEISKHPFPWDSFIMGVLAVCLLILGLKYLIVHREEKSSRTIGRVKYIVLLLAALFFAKEFLSTLSYGGSSEAEFAKRYYSGEYSVVEGVVEEFNESNQGIASFDLEGMSFCLNYFFENPIPQGKPLRVYYLYDDDEEYVVLKVEVKKE